MKGRLHTRYAPVRRSQGPKASTPRLACVKPAASVHPEPGSNSSSYIVILYIRCLLFWPFRIFRLYCSYFFCSEISFRTAVNSICLRTCLSFVSPVSQSGCKTRKLISNWQMFFEVFFKIFRFNSNFPITNLSKDFPCFAGCKCKKHFRILQAFSNLFSEKSLFL